ncbi:MAG TPA: hypothetical protein VF040_15225 [Ktedonobacterales bacterium]
MKYLADRIAMYSILVVVGINYLAQIPYYLHLYYFPHRMPPPLVGTSLMVVTFVWFLLGWMLLARGRRAGYWLLLTFLLTEFIFYLSNMIDQVMHGFSPLFQLQNPDPLLVPIFAIGYLNLIGAGLFAIFLIWRYRTLVAGQQPA